MIRKSFAPWAGGRRSKKVLIVGGGVAGMSVAHELMNRSTRSVPFDIHVLERHPRSPGGKARSIFVPDETPDRDGARAAPGRGPRHLPGEHGFRFFPAFYRHLCDTMGGIPYGKGRSVADNLVRVDKVLIARSPGRTNLELPLGLPVSLADWAAVLRLVIGPEREVELEESRFFMRRLWQLLTSSDERRFTEYEHATWWDYVRADAFSPGYRRLFVSGLSHSLLANHPKRASARTVGMTSLQLLFDSFEARDSPDRVLNGPTSVVWLRPWLRHLEQRVRYHFGATARSIAWQGGRIAGVEVDQGGQRRLATADLYVFAIPVEQMARVLEASAPPDGLPGELGSLCPLASSVAPMVGVQFFLSEDARLAPGHVLYIDSAWALTSISQAQFWSEYAFARRPGESVRGVISVCVSDCESPGIRHRKPARACAAREIAEEVWAQLEAHFAGGRRTFPSRAAVLSWAVDEGALARAPHQGEPLFVNRAGTWPSRPSATTSVPNLFLAADYVRTHSDVACMEAANEAARRAVNGILDATGSPAPPCRTWTLREPAAIAPLRAMDAHRFARGLPWSALPV